MRALGNDLLLVLMHNSVLHLEVIAAFFEDLNGVLVALGQTLEEGLQLRRLAQLEELLLVEDHSLALHQKLEQVLRVVWVLFDNLGSDDDLAHHKLKEGVVYGLHHLLWVRAVEDSLSGLEGFVVHQQALLPLLLTGLAKVFVSFLVVFVRLRRV